MNRSINQSQCLFLKQSPRVWYVNQATSQERETGRREKRSFAALYFSERSLILHTLSLCHGTDKVHLVSYSFPAPIASEFLDDNIRVDLARQMSDYFLRRWNGSRGKKRAHIERESTAPTKPVYKNKHAISWKTCRSEVLAQHKHHKMEWLRDVVLTVSYLSNVACACVCGCVQIERQRFGARQWTRHDQVLQTTSTSLSYMID